MYKVRIIAEHFNIGSTHYPVGSEVEVNEVVGDYLLKNGSAEAITDGYLRRDMKAQTNPKPKRGRPRKKKVAA